MNRKIWSWTLLCLALASGPGWAQSTDIIEQIENSTPRERAEAQAEVLADVLDLSPRQTGELIEINLKYSSRIQELIDGGAQDSILFSEIEKSSRAKDEEIVALLTKTQARRYEAHKTRMRRIVEDLIEKRNR